MSIVKVIQTTVSLLAELCAAEKIDELSFGSCLGSYSQLWAMTDRAVRTELLRTLKSISACLSSETINKKIFDQMLSGFSDSNSKYDLLIMVCCSSSCFTIVFFASPATGCEKTL